MNTKITILNKVLNTYNDIKLMKEFHEIPVYASRGVCDYLDYLKIDKNIRQEIVIDLYEQLDSLKKITIPKEKIGIYFFFPPIITITDNSCQIIDYESLELRINLINKTIKNYK